MNVLINGVNFSNHIESISWSGDENQLARKVTITYLYAPDSVPGYSVAASKGDRLVMSEGGQVLFDGIVVSEERSESGINMQNMAYDYAWYLRSKTLGVYKGTPGQILSKVCGENGIPCGDIYDPGGEAEVISTGEKSISQVIAEAYEGYDTHIYMSGMNLCIEKYGTELAGVVTGDDYVTDGTYKSSIENIVNKVVLLNASEQPVGEVSNGLMQYGVIQDVYKIAGSGEDPITEAEKLLKGIEESGKIVVKGSPFFQTGKAVIVEKVNSKIKGRFVIISDSHSIQDAKHTTTLGLRFETVL